MGSTTDQPTAEELAAGQASISHDDGHSDPINPSEARTEFTRQLMVRDMEIAPGPAIIEPKTVGDHLDQAALFFGLLTEIKPDRVICKTMRRVLIVQEHISTNNVGVENVLWHGTSLYNLENGIC